MPVTGDKWNMVYEMDLEDWRRETSRMKGIGKKVRRMYYNCIDD
jgi:hypothetical protein